MGTRGVLALHTIIALAYACGSGASGGGSRAGSGGDAGTDDAAITCMQSPMVGGSSGGNTYDVYLTEGCSDGNSYEADCTCTFGASAGTCDCYKNGASTGSSVPYSCASGHSGQWTACGFPQGTH